MAETASADVIEAVRQLVGMAHLPELPPAGIGWVQSRAYLLEALSQAGDVVKQIADAVPGSDVHGVESVHSVTDQIEKIAVDAVQQIADGVTSLSGAAVLHAIRQAMARSIVAGWRAAMSLEAIYAIEDPAQAQAAFDALGMKQDDRVRDYSMRLGMAQAISRLGAAGIVELLVEPPPEAEVVPSENPWLIVLAVVGIAGLVLLAYICEQFYEQYKFDERWRLACVDPATGKVKAGLEKVCAGNLSPPPGSGGIPWTGIAIGAAALGAIMLWKG